MTSCSLVCRYQCFAGKYILSIFSLPCSLRQHVPLERWYPIQENTVNHIPPGNFANGKLVV